MTGQPQPVTQQSLLKERVTLRAIILTLLAFLAGIGLLYWSAQVDWWLTKSVWQVMVQQVAQLLLTSVTVAILWELVGRRAFLDEVLSKVNMAKELTFAGVIQITDTFHQVGWAEFFQTSTTLDIFFAYGRTWMGTHDAELKLLAATPKSRIRVVLPDPDHKETVAELARRFNKTPDQIVELVRESADRFNELKKTKHEQSEVMVWYLPAAPLFTFYRFKNIAVLALYNHRPGREPVPSFVVQKGGTLFEYVVKEFHAMIDEGGLGRRA